MKYTIVDINRYLEIILATMDAEDITTEFVESIKERFYNISGGLKFVIAVGNSRNPMFYSVEYFNNQILGG